MYCYFRRTGKVIEINARLDDDGYERVSDYFPDTGLYNSSLGVPWEGWKIKGISTPPRQWELKATTFTGGRN
jgi:hypothetical protein